MRMRQSAKKTYYWRPLVSAKNEEGASYETWDDPVEIEAEIWPAGGRVQAEQYGMRLSYMKNMLYDGSEALMEGDGICVDVDSDEDPDYRIVSAQREYMPLVIELEKVVP